MKDQIESALASMYVSLLFTRGLITAAMSSIDIVVKSALVALYGFLVALFLASTITAVRSIVARTTQKVGLPWPSNLRGAKKLALLVLLAASGTAATYILVTEIRHTADLFEIVLLIYATFMFWTMFVLEVVSTKTAMQDTPIQLQR